MRAARRLVAASVVVALVVGAAACGGDDDAGEAGAEGDGLPEATGADVPVELPFGLTTVEGTEPIGRPAVYDHALYYLRGEPVQSRSLRAAYRVTGDDAPAALRAWVDQLDGLRLGEVLVEPGYDHAQWMTATSVAPSDVGDRGGDHAGLDLRSTGDGAVLLVWLNRVDEAPPEAPTVVDDGGSPPEPAARDLGPADRGPGDVLFTEQGDDIHVPEGTRTLMPTIPTTSGTGGSTSILAAEDGEAAIRALLDEAAARGPGGDVEEPEVDVVDGVEVVQAGFTIPAGGWTFDAVSVRGPDDPSATVYVTTSAD